MKRKPFPARGVAAALLTALLLSGLLAATPVAAAPTLPPTTSAPTGAIPTPGPMDTLTSTPSPAGRTTGTARPSGAQASAQVGAPAAAAGPQLQIAVDNGRTSAAPGQVLDYVLTLTNLGSSTVKGLRVTQSVPTGLTLLQADRGGQAKDGNVGWKIDLDATKAATFHVRMKVSATPRDLLRLATVACAGLASKTAPIVCASHSDLLPAGVVAASATTAGKTTPAAAAGAPASPRAAEGTGSGGHGAVVAGVVGVGVVLLVLLTFLVLRRRRASASAD